jgi:hypothetical protein
VLHQAEAISSEEDMSIGKFGIFMIVFPQLITRKGCEKRAEVAEI